MVTNANLHYTIIQKIIENGYAPSVDVLSETLSVSKDEIIKGLNALQEYHAYGTFEKFAPKALPEVAPDWSPLYRTGDFRKLYLS